MIEFDGAAHPDPDQLVRYIGFLSERGHFSLNQKTLPAGIDPGNAQWRTGQAVWIPIASTDPSFQRPAKQKFKEAVASVTNDAGWRTSSLEFVEGINPNLAIGEPTLREYRAQSWPLTAGNMIAGGTTRESKGPTPLFNEVLANVSRTGSSEVAKVTRMPQYFPLPDELPRPGLGPRAKAAVATIGLAMGLGATYLTFFRTPEPEPTPQTKSLPVAPSQPHKSAKPKNPDTHHPRPPLSLKHHDTKPKAAPKKHHKKNDHKKSDRKSP